MRSLKFVLSMISLITLSPSVQSQSATGKPYNLILPYGKYVYQYVDTKVRQWQEQGRYESNEEYLHRVNEQTRNKMIIQMEDEATAKYKAMITKNINWNHLQLEDYDANNETFLIKSDRFGYFALYVPRIEAKEFENNFGMANKTEPDFYFYKDSVFLAKLTISLQSSGKQYTYDSEDPHRFVARKIEDADGRFGPIVPRGGGTPPPPPPIVLVGSSDVDVNIPETGAKNDKTFVVIIANENYEKEAPATFAVNNGRIFREYCIKTLGIPENQIRKFEDTKIKAMSNAINWFEEISKAHNGNINIIFYYSGHGIPDKKNNTVCLMPVDVDASNIFNSYYLDDLYKKLGSLSTGNVFVFLDACFSGVQYGGKKSKILAALPDDYGVGTHIEKSVLSGNTVVFAASQSNETAFPYFEKQHGLFTYFLLKKLQESKGDITLGELSQYITRQVKETSVKTGSYELQTPEVTPSPALKDKWETMKLK